MNKNCARALRFEEGIYFFLFFIYKENSYNGIGDVNIII